MKFTDKARQRLQAAAVSVAKKVFRARPMRGFPVVVPIC
jgi:hypothetical protein